MYIREAEKKVKEINETFRILLVTGPRQVGKTTLLKKEMPKNMNYVTLDDETLRRQAKENPKLFLMEHQWPLLIDEAQYAPELFPYIKMIVDEHNLRGMYWLTGSQQFNLMKNVTESLAGRVGIVKLNSFTYAEIIQNNKRKLFDPSEFMEAPLISVNDLFEIIYNGGMPETYNIKNMNRDSFYEEYLETYVSRDIGTILNIKNKELFKKFIVAMAVRNGEPINYNNISREIGISTKTVVEWVNVLVTSGLIYLLEPFRNTKLSRITHIHKIIFMDTGLCSYLADWESSRSLQLSESSGHYLETFIISDIIKSYNAHGKKLNISYYRDKDKKEIDLIIEKNNTIYPFEIKKTAEPTVGMIKNFKILEKTGKAVAPGGIICFFDRLMHLDEKNYIIPVGSVLNIE